MGAIKKDIYKKEQLEIAALFKAVAHPARIAILEYLFSIRSCVCGDIVEEINLAQSTVSQHLKELKKAGLIKGETEGASVCYCLNPEKIAYFTSHFNSFMKDSGCCNN